MKHIEVKEADAPYGKEGRKKSGRTSIGRGQSSVVNTFLDGYSKA